MSRIPDNKGYSYNQYNQDKVHPILGNLFKGRDSQGHLDVPKTKSAPVRNVPKGSPAGGAQDKNRMRNPNRPAHQNVYKTISGASLGKASGWQTRGDKRKHVMGKAYSMNQVSMARIMKGNVNANEGAYMKRGGDRQV